MWLQLSLFPLPDTGTKCPTTTVFIKFFIAADCWDGVMGVTSEGRWTQRLERDVFWLSDHNLVMGQNCPSKGFCSQTNVV